MYNKNTTIILQNTTIINICGKSSIHLKKLNDQ